MIHSMQDTFRTDITSWTIGPYHGSLPAPMKLRLSLDGEIITDCEVETGFLHRGLEKSIELHSWKAAIAYSDHLDPECALFGELVLCLAVEQLAGVEVPERAQCIRLVLSELTRISGHLSFMVRMARAVGSETIIHYLLRDREKVLDLFELLTGARFSLNFLRYGGVRADVTDGFIERVLEACELIRIRMKEYNDLFTFNFGFLKRTSEVGVISKRLAETSGMTGPNARASGIEFDVRKSFPYSGFHRLDFEIPVGKGNDGILGDVHDRFLIRLREITQSMEILKQLLDVVPSGDYMNNQLERLSKIPSGEAYVRIESSKGLLGCHVVSEGTAFPSRVQFRTPSMAHLLAIPEIVRGIRIEDLAVVLASLDLGIAEADR